MPDLILDDIPQEDLPPARAVNHVRVSRIGHETQIILGYVDLSAIADGAEEIQQAVEEDGDGEDVHLHIQPVGRITVGPRGLHDLKTKVEEIYEKMAASGHLPDDLIETDEEEEEEAEDEPAEG